MDPLTDDELKASHPAVAELVTKLDDIARRDPSPSVCALAGALAVYFRTPD